MARDDAPGSVIADLRRSYHDLTPSQKRIAELVVEEPELVAFATLGELALRLAVSPSTIVRFAYRLGMDGYPELQSRVRRLVRASMRPRSGLGEAPAAIAAHLGGGALAASLVHDLDNLRDTVERLDLAELERAVELLVGAEWLFVAGGLASESLARYVALAFGRMRGRTSVLNGDGHTAPSLLDMRARDAVLAFSFPPYSSSTLQAVQAATEQGVPVIAITDTPVAPIASRVEVVLATRVSGLGPQSSLVAPMAVANALLNAVLGELAEAPARYARLCALTDGWDSFVPGGEDA